MEYPVPQLVEINNDENRFDHKIHDYATFEELDEVQKENDDDIDGNQLSLTVGGIKAYNT